MKELIQFVSVCILWTVLTSAAMAEPKAGQQTTHSVSLDVDGEKIDVGFHLYLPKNYDSESKVPLLLFLHGSGERGDDLSLVLKWGPPKHISKGTDYPCVVLSPQCPSDERWRPEALVQLVDWAQGALQIDGTRMYVTGLSMGGTGTLALIDKYPKLFAAAVPICGAIETKQPERLAEVPIRAFVGSEDKVVHKMVDLIKSVQDARGKAKLHIFNAVGHVSWPMVYEDDEYLAWLLMHKRGDK